MTSHVYKREEGHGTIPWQAWSNSCTSEPDLVLDGWDLQLSRVASLEYIQEVSNEKYKMKS